MKPRKSYKQTLQFISVAVIFILWGTTETFGQIVLADSPVTIKPAEFYIAEVNDERDKTGPVATLILKDKNKIVTEVTDLKGGPSAAISAYLMRNLRKNTALRAAVLGIRDMKLKETALPDGSIEGNIRMYISFGLKKDYGVAPLTASLFAVRYVRSAENTLQPEGYIRGVIIKGLAYFDRWTKANAASDRRLAKNVRFTFSDYHESTEGDTIYYSAGRKLTWADFQWHNIFSSKYDALVIPGIGYDQEATISNGTINVGVSLKAYLPKSACWARFAGRDDYTLNHEQRHFDIAKIIIEQFKQKVLAAKLTPDTYEAFLNMQYLDSMRDMHTMQEAYDNETAHGLNRAAQEAWNNKIDKELGLHGTAS